MPEYEFEHRLRVRYAETDQMGVAHHSSYVIWFEEARTAFMRARGLPYSELERAGWALVVRRVALRYRVSTRYEEELAVRVRTAALGRASLTFEYEIARTEDGLRIATGSTELACVDLSHPERRPTALPERLLQRLSSPGA